MASNPLFSATIISTQEKVEVYRAMRGVNKNAYINYNNPSVVYQTSELTNIKTK